MTPEQAVEVLKGVPLFEGMSHEHLRELARFARKVRYAPESVIIQEGEIDDRLFVVLAGEVKAVKDHLGPKERPLGFVGEGMYFGEMALIDNYERTATVVANLETECLELRHLDFMELLHANPQISVRMLPILARRLRTAQELI
jgi:CRP-like cAMP-binding protein